MVGGLVGALNHFASVRQLLKSLFAALSRVEIMQRTCCKKKKKKRNYDQAGVAAFDDCACMYACEHRDAHASLMLCAPQDSSSSCGKLKHIFLAGAATARGRI